MNIQILETEEHLQANKKAIELAEYILESLPTDSQDKVETLTYIGKLKSDRAWLEQIKEEEICAYEYC